MPMELAKIVPKALTLSNIWKLFLSLLAAGIVRRLLKGENGRRRIRSGASTHDRHDGREKGGSKGGGKGRKSDRQRDDPHHPDGPLSPGGNSDWVGPALESELGATWNFGGRRRWEWLHDGRIVNGWIELGRGGVLRTSFDRLNRSPGSWKIRPCPEADELIATFGRCHHTLRLVPDRPVPEFRVAERVVFSGKPFDRRAPRTVGRLDLKHGQGDSGSH